MLRLLLMTVFFCGVEKISFAQNWQKLGNGNNALRPNNSIWTTCVDSDIVYAAGGFTTGLTTGIGHFYVAKWNGTSWTEIGSGSNALNANGGINAICVDDAHNLYAAGGFTNVSGKYYVAKWDGISWTELGVGSNALNANNYINSICTDHFGNLFAAGAFTDSVSETSGHEYVAKWDGTAWTVVGVDINALNANAAIRCIASDASRKIYAGGDFSMVTSEHQYYIAEWNGTNWAPLGTGNNALNADAPIWSLNLDKDGKVYTAGFFENAAGKSYVASWDGNTWTELGGYNSLHSDEAILSTCTDSSNNIYAACFSAATGNTYVAKWNGLVWTEVGNGANGLNGNGSIFTICTDRYNNIYAAGAFTDSISNNVGYPYVAKYLNATKTPAVAKIAETFSAFPIPIRDVLNIAITKEQFGVPYSISDFNGKQIRKGKIANTNFVIDMSQLQTGTYLLTVGNESISVIKE